MISYTTTIHKFEQQGEKTGWTYIEIPADLAQELFPGNKKTFRVKGRLDAFAIKSVAILPMGDGTFILPLNASMRKGAGKKEGATLQVQLSRDLSAFELNAALLEGLREDEAARLYFESLAPSHQRYFSKWIDDAKTDMTRLKRLTQCLLALSQGKDYGTMIRAQKQNKVS